MQCKTDEEWEAESDANTLAEANVIQADEGRMTKAKTAAKKMAKEAEIRAKSLEDLVDGTGKTKEEIKKLFPNSWQQMYPGMT